MALLKMPANRPEYRADRPHEDFVVTLSDAGVAGRGELLDSIVGAMAARFELREVGVGETVEARATKHRQSTRMVDVDAELAAVRERLAGSGSA
jgi:hypothetical protein